MFGNGWRSTYEERLIFISSDPYLKYARSDGSVWWFSMSTEGPPTAYMTAAPADDTTTTITKGSPNWTLTTKAGAKRIFDGTTGLLTAIVDRNGNTTQLSYDSSHRLVTVTDAALRHLSFGYADGSSSLVTSVTSDVGISLSYTYDGQGRLIKVTKPDTTTVSFEYDINSMITAVRDSDGKILESHTYDALGRGLTSSRANGVDAVTISYPQ
jgi:YD repeat-containing protein